MNKTSFQKFKNKAIIISGFPKSGTTLFQSLLDGHQQLLVFPEELHFDRIIYPTEIAGKKLTTEEKINRLLKLKNLQKSREGGPMGARDYSDFDYNKFKNILLLRLKNVKNNKDILLAVMESFYEADNSDKTDKRAWVEKTPANYFYFPFFKKWFGDDLVWIHIARNPYDNFVSYRKIFEGESKKKTAVKRFCLDWVLSNKLAKLAHQKIKNHHIIQYEDLLKEPEKVMKKVCDWVGINWDNFLLSPTFLGQQWGGNSMHNQKFQGISVKPIGRHKELEFKETEEMKKYLEQFNLMFWLHIQKRFLLFYLRWKFLPIYRTFLKFFIRIKKPKRGYDKYEVQFMREN